MDADYFREKAEQCRLVLSIAVNPQVREQIRVWAREFDSMADELEANEDLREFAEDDA
jgi:hypothetical protein